jgi:pantoate--beta-alanine ligase
VGAVERLRELGAGREILGESAPREPDGLLASVRNADLSPEERRAAPAVFRALLAGRLLHGLGETKAAKLLKATRMALEMEPGLTVEAVDVVDALTMRTVEKINGPAILVAAAWAGKTLLADSVRLDRGP